MSVATEIARIQDARNVIRTKLVTLKLATSTADIDECANAIDGIEDRGAVSANIQEGDTYTIPKGYHNGSGTVSGVAGGGNYSLQSKSVTPTKKQQNVTPDSGYYGISDVTVNPIPENYHDVTPVTAGAGDVLANKLIVDATGKTIAGTMTNWGDASIQLDGSRDSYTIPAGYHNGKGEVTVKTETLTVNPSFDTEVHESTGFIKTVIVNPIPSKYIDTTDATAAAGNILTGKTAYVNGAKVTGNMANNEDWGMGLDMLNQSCIIPAGYHSGNGTVAANVENITVTPSKEEAWYAGTNFIGTVCVEAIPDNYIDTTDADAVAGEILSGKTAYVDGVKLTGTMKNNGYLTRTIDGMTVTSYTLPAGYISGGILGLTSDIEDALAAI